jgi:hypothetical protein
MNLSYSQGWDVPLLFTGLLSTTHRGRCIPAVHNNSYFNWLDAPLHCDGAGDDVRRAIYVELGSELVLQLLLPVDNGTFRVGSCPLPFCDLALQLLLQLD